VTKETDVPGPERRLAAVLSADMVGYSRLMEVDEMGTLADLDHVQLRDLADRLGDLERAVSFDRRALHERIDVLQAELVERHKSGRATVDGLLS